MPVTRREIEMPRRRWLTSAVAQLGFLIVLAPIMVGPAPARAAEPFEMFCPGDEVLAGIRGKQGFFWWVRVIHEIEPLCVALNPDLSWDGEPAGPGLSISPGPGDAFDLQCPEDHAVFSIGGTRGWYVDSLQIACLSLLDFEADPFTSEEVGGQGGESWNSACESGLGNGLSGTFGEVIDTLELSCAPIAVTTVASAPQLVAPAAGVAAPSPRPEFTWSWNPPVDPTTIPRSKICFTSPDGLAAGNYCDLAQVCIESRPGLGAEEPCEQVASPLSYIPDGDLPFGGREIYWTVRGCNVAGACGDFALPRWLNPPAGTTPPPTTASFTADLYPIYSHPRCTNCHAGYNPFGQPQGQGNHPVIGEGNRGDPATCAGCHNVDPDEANEWRNWKPPDGPDPAVIPVFADEGPTGTGGPARSAGEICETVRSEVQAKGWERADFEHHVAEDILIGWSFEPTGNMDDATAGQSATQAARDTSGNPNLTPEAARSLFVAISLGWFDAGMPCEGEADAEFAYDAGGADAGFGFSLGAIIGRLGLIGIDGVVLQRDGRLAGARIPKKLKGDVDPPDTVRIGRVKYEGKPTGNAWVPTPVPGGLTRERVQVLERAGLHPYASSFKEVQRLLRAVETGRIPTPSRPTTRP